MKSLTEEILQYVIYQPYKKAEVETRFWKNVNVGQEDDCWEWKLSKAYGYGRTCVSSGGISSNLHSHCLAYMLYNSIVIPYAVDVCHKCDNRACCNPNHLFSGSSLDNARDKVKKERQAFGTRQGISVLNESEVEDILEMRRQGFFTKANC